MPHDVPIDGVLDLHFFSSRDVKSVVEECLHASALAGWQEIRLVHGRGTGVQRRVVQTILEQHPAVEVYWDAPNSHLGATIAALKT